MAKIDLGGKEYDLDIDIQEILDKIHAAANGEDIPGVQVFHLPENQFTAEESTTTGAGNGLSWTMIAVIGGIIALLFIPARK